LHWRSKALLALLALAILPSGAAAAPTITQFVAGNGPQAATAGPDGKVWFVEANSPNRIASVTPAGVVTHYSTGLSSNVGLAGIATGPDGNVWFTESNTDRVGRITPAGVITEFSAGITAGSAPHGIAAGPDGNLWFTEAVGNRIGRITTAGVVTEFSTGITPGRVPWGITAGPDGNLWFTEHVTFGHVARITTAGVVTEFATVVGLPAGITAGPDGNVWLAVNANPGYIARVAPSGTITQFSTGLSTNSGPENIVTGSDGNLYFTENRGADALGKITPAGLISEFNGGLNSPFGIATGADGNVWFTDDGADRVGRLTVAPAAVTNAPLSTSDSGATLSGTVGPNSQATTYDFEWGLAATYGASTPTTSAGSGAVGQTVTAAITGLTVSATYHYRVVATNASGTTYGQDKTFTALPLPVTPPPGTTPSEPADSKLPPATRPVFGRSATIAAVSGVVLVQLRGTTGFVPLSAASTVPVGTTIDASAGTVKLTSVRDRGGKLQTGKFWGGAFKVAQTRRKHSATVLTLTAPMTCPKARSLTSLGARAAPRRHLWGNDNHGRFVTRGRSAVATVRGTAWLMQDTCAGTLVKVSRGSVSVLDLVKHDTVLVTAGHSYLARRR
jgi:streptogramin lyase